MKVLNLLVICMVAAVLLVQPSGATKDKSRPCVAPAEARDPTFRPGQVWQYKTRADESDSTITILKIESLPKLGVIIHVRVDHIRLKNCNGGPEPDTLEHMPFARAAIESSVTKLVREGKVPDFSDGYEQWRKDCGGVYTISVADAVSVAEQTYRKGFGCA